MIDIFIPTFVVGFSLLMFYQKLSQPSRKFFLIGLGVIFFILNFSIYFQVNRSSLTGLGFSSEKENSAKSVDDFFHSIRENSSFLRGIDGYDVDTVIFPKLSLFKNPILYRATNFVDGQISGAIYLGYRILSMNGVEINSLSHLLEEWSAVPARGVAHFRLVFPTPDNALHSIFISPSFMNWNEIVKNHTRAKDYFPIGDFLTYTGNRGIPGKFLAPMGDSYQIIFGSKEGGALSLYQLQQYLDSADYEGENVRLNLYNSNGFFNANDDIDFLVQPRLLLAPWIGGNLFSQSTLGLFSHFTRIILGLRHLPTILFHREMFPNQHYRLLDKISLVSFQTRLLSVLASLLLVFLLSSDWWMRICKVHWMRPFYSGPKAALGIRLLLFSLLQFCDIFVVRVLSIT